MEADGVKVEDESGVNGLDKGGKDGSKDVGGMGRSEML